MRQNKINSTRQTQPEEASDVEPTTALTDRGGRGRRPELSMGYSRRLSLRSDADRRTTVRHDSARYRHDRTGEARFRSGTRNRRYALHDQYRPVRGRGGLPDSRADNFAWLQPD